MGTMRGYGGVVSQIRVSKDAPPGGIFSSRQADADAYEIVMHPVDWERLETQARSTWRPDTEPELGAPWFLAGIPVKFEAPDG